MVTEGSTVTVSYTFLANGRNTEMHKMKPAFVYYRKVGADFLASSFERVEEEFSFTKNYPQNINHVTIAKSDFVCFQMNQTIISDKTQKIVNHNKVSYLEMTWQPPVKNCQTISPQFYAKIICENAENCRISCRRKYRFNKPREYKIKK